MADLRMGRLGAEIANLRAGFGPKGSLTIRCGKCGKAADSRTMRSASAPRS